MATIQPDALDIAGSPNEEEPGAATIATRRALLRGAAGGFTLAASGLFLPSTTEDVAARAGKRGRKRRRTHGDDKKENKRQRGGRNGRSSRPLFRDTSLSLDIMDGRTQHFTFSATFYFRVLSGGLDDYNGPWIDSGTSVQSDGRTLKHRYAPERFRVGVLLRAFDGGYRAPDLFVDVRNIAFAAPRVAAYSGQNLDPASGKLGEPVINEREMELVWIPFQGTKPRNFGLEYELRNSPRDTCTGSLFRYLDSDDFLEFELKMVVL